MSKTHLVRLGDYCEQDRTTIRPGDGRKLRYVGLETIESGTGVFQRGELSKTPETPQANSFRFGPEHVLYGKLRPYLNKVAIPDFEGKCSTEIIPLRPRAELDRRYLSFFLRSASVVDRISKRTAGARMPRADMGFVFDLRIPLPPIPEQRCIVELLSQAEGIVRLRREAQAKVAEIVPALFFKMFGDPNTNADAWPIVALSEVAEVISGIAKGRNLVAGESVELPYMRVANVKDGYLDLSAVKTIEVRHSEVDRLLIQPGDLLMTEGGDPDKLGRAALWSGEIESCVHQNHIFKVRCNRNRVLPPYLRSLAGSSYGKAYFLSVAKKTTGIASINKTQLSAFPVLLPSLELQARFSALVAATQGVAVLQDSAVGKADATFQALLSGAFSGGELVNQDFVERMAVL